VSVNREDSQLSGLRILVVEDDLLIAMEIEERLCGFGCEVVGPYGRLGEAFAAATDNLDGAILDLNLRGEYTFRLIERLQARSVPVIVCSGYVDVPELKEKLVSVPMLAKPCDPDRLAAMMQAYFSRRPKAAPGRSEACTPRP